MAKGSVTDVRLLFFFNLLLVHLTVDETSLHRKHVHTGSAHGFLFHVEYLVKEVKARFLRLLCGGSQIL